eukprot:364708-Chlamydomonas_euryale.AAC.7
MLADNKNVAGGTHGELHSHGGSKKISKMLYEVFVLKIDNGYEFGFTMLHCAALYSTPFRSVPLNLVQQQPTQSALNNNNNNDINPT